MIQFLLAAPNSGSGKTTLACALLAALKNRGTSPVRSSAGRTTRPHVPPGGAGGESHNLDLFFSSPETVRGLLRQRQRRATVPPSVRGPWAFTMA